ncbi:Ca(2+)-dependent cysteine protease [Haplosporangium sp. Z 767]|nr:Ca(2+)-dependent cysteine protease [Haplosporangium sp. Z 11]KAF9191593.1 Ca(2+)-dependent cysteine protease [Haplosporangium sp. Z 767]
MYPGHYQAPQQYPQQYGAPPGHPPGAPYTPPAQPGYPPPASAYPAYPPQPQYAPPASSPYPPAAGAYPPPVAAPYGAPPVPYQPPYGAPPTPMAYPPHAPPAYPPPAQGGYAPPGHAPPPAPMYPIPQNMMTPVNVPPPPQGWSMHQNPHMMPPANFQLSSCQGRKRALFIGINYFRQRNELRGCINDVKNIKAFIIRQFGFREEDTISLTDDQQDPTRIPTRANIIAGMQWLVKDARPNDSFFFHFSGHGGQTVDTNGDEEDGHDETIYPVDHQRAGVIVDDTLHSILVRPLPAGCRLTAIMDCCHSGSALDLPYIYNTTGQLKEGGVLNDLGGGLKNAGMSYLKGDIGGVLNSLGGMGKRITNPNKRAENIRNKSSPSDCIMFSGCKDTQTSADAHEQGFGMTGAMTFSFISALSANPRQSYIQLLNSIRDILRSKYSQKPQLSSSHPVDLNLIFTM